MGHLPTNREYEKSMLKEYRKIKKENTQKIGNIFDRLVGGEM